MGTLFERLFPLLERRWKDLRDEILTISPSDTEAAATWFANSFSVEGLPYARLSWLYPGMFPEIRTFRKLRADRRISICKRYIEKYAKMPKKYRIVLNVSVEGPDINRTPCHLVFDVMAHDETEATDKFCKVIQERLT